MLSFGFLNIQNWSIWCKKSAGARVFHPVHGANITIMSELATADKSVSDSYHCSWQDRFGLPLSEIKVVLFQKFVRILSGKSATRLT